MIITGWFFQAVPLFLPFISGLGLGDLGGLGGGGVGIGSGGGGRRPSSTCAPVPASCPDDAGCTQTVNILGSDSSGCPLYGCRLDTCPEGPFG